MSIWEKLRDIAMGDFVEQLKELEVMPPESLRSIYAKSQKQMNRETSELLRIAMAIPTDKSPQKSVIEAFHGGPMPVFAGEQTVQAPIWSFHENNTSLRPIGYESRTGLTMPSAFDCILLNNFPSLVENAQLQHLLRYLLRFTTPTTIFVTHHSAYIPEQENPLPQMNFDLLQTHQAPFETIKVYVPKRRHVTSYNDLYLNSDLNF